ncbi:caspase-1 [Solenopsis invicta]|uniref:caspase-1 n=1 Tax=Solenopsis invicta TaxID=13686 RepID=UPI00193DBF1F|nr:caspase-1 [Solenopsis invicta]
MESAIDEAEVQINIDEVDVEASTIITQRNRSNSAIDSCSYRKYLLVEASCRSRSRSLSSTDYYASPEQNEPEINMDLYTSAKSFQSNEKISDAVDASPDSVPYKPAKQYIPTAVMPVHKNANCYNMNHKNRGKCIIFNHEEFDFLELAKREGSTYDTLRLQKAFGNLDFDIEIHDNLTHNQITDVIEKVSQLDHTDNDCLCVIVLTHGLQNDMISAKDVIYKSDRLWKPFTADKCVTLAGKPKLFFIQACRGDEADGGILLESRKMEKEQTETDSVSSYSIPTHADFLIAHSSVQGFFTWRDPSEGTWYIQCLCDVLDEHGTEMDLMSMLTITARKVATEYASVHVDDDLHNKKQVPSVTTMLTRFVYFPQKSVTDSEKDNK